ncbi:MAG: 2-C-methyl-D-erythritol 4-phosphate cytidylyltransferase, partial [Alphaproteobacteria bacterium]
MTTATPTLAAIIVAAGSGSRMAQDTPKQFLDLCGKPVLRHSIDAFLSHPMVSELVIVGATDQLSRIDELISTAGPVSGRTKARMQIVSGGARRQDSVRAGLDALAGTDAVLVAIHDAARPFLDRRIIDNLIAALQAGADAALPVMPVVDTLKSVEGEKINGTVDRASLRAAQT